MKKRLFFVITFIFFLLPFGTSWAQDDPELRLSMLRNFGSSLGTSIQGTFTYRVSGPDDLVRVMFLLDGEPTGEDVEAPFRWQFNTGSYEVGTHTMSAVGYTVDGRELQSNVLQRQFISGSESNRLLYWIIIPIIVLAIGGRLISSWIANRGSKESEQPAISGPFGGTLCPKCGRPFAMHIWGLNVVAGKFDRCPHCGNWSLVRRVHPDALRSAAEAFADDGETAVSPPQDDTDSLHKRLDDSRFEDL
jgi:DNA-directed RNA polymerase subunit RPC12/RpoP